MQAAVLEPTTFQPVYSGSVSSHLKVLPPTSVSSMVGPHLVAAVAGIQFLTRTRTPQSVYIQRSRPPIACTTTLRYRDHLLITFLECNWMFSGKAVKLLDNTLDAWFNISKSSAGTTAKIFLVLNDRGSIIYLKVKFHLKHDKHSVRACDYNLTAFWLMSIEAWGAYFPYTTALSQFVRENSFD